MQRRARYASIIRIGREEGGRNARKSVREREYARARIKMQTFDSVLDGLMPRPISGRGGLVIKSNEITQRLMLGMRVLPVTNQAAESPLEKKCMYP